MNEEQPPAPSGKEPELITDPQHIIFEGCDSVVMSPEDFDELCAEVERLRGDMKRFQNSTDCVGTGCKAVGLRERAESAERKLAEAVAALKQCMSVLLASLKLWEADARLWPAADKVINPLLKHIDEVTK